MKQSIEKHPLGFFLPKNAEVLILGSFPPKKERWSMDFYYPNFQNDMWRIFGLVFFNDKNYFINEAKNGFDKGIVEPFCKRKGIAIGDSAIEIIRLKDNASDKFLQVVKAIDIEKTLKKLPKCRAIVSTGQKSMETLLSVCSVKEPKIASWSPFSILGRTIKLFRMPSSSRAYPLSLEKKALIYKKMFQNLNFI
ncbi:MAG: uracil-DNA glycosylase family protein [Elusimicrobiota bacterium]|jgi:G:T/U-mismatch repair DNA glycosylase|nr:uracil-DNA glycosylase family protein [Elusimicrobiota bacterium]